MRPAVPAKLNSCRILKGQLASDPSFGFNGAFWVWCRSVRLMVIISDGMGPDPWEHASVSRVDRTPTWEEMCFIKDLIWGPDEVVIQYHPRASEYRNLHRYCLHMWRPIGVELPTPRPELVA